MRKKTDGIVETRVQEVQAKTKRLVRKRVKRNYTRPTKTIISWYQLSERYDDLFLAHCKGIAKRNLIDLISQQLTRKELCSIPPDEECAFGGVWNLDYVAINKASLDFLLKNFSINSERTNKNKRYCYVHDFKTENYAVELENFKILFEKPILMHLKKELQYKTIIQSVFKRHELKSRLRNALNDLRKEQENKLNKTTVEEDSSGEKSNQAANVTVIWRPLKVSREIVYIAKSPNNVGSLSEVIQPYEYGGYKFCSFENRYYFVNYAMLKRLLVLKKTGIYKHEIKMEMLEITDLNELVDCLTNYKITDETPSFFIRVATSVLAASISGSLNRSRADFLEPILTNYEQKRVTQEKRKKRKNKVPITQVKTTKCRKAIISIIWKALKVNETIYHVFMANETNIPKEIRQSLSDTLRKGMTHSYRYTHLKLQFFIINASMHDGIKTRQRRVRFDHKDEEGEKIHTIDEFPDLIETVKNFDPEALRSSMLNSPFLRQFQKDVFAELKLENSSDGTASWSPRIFSDNVSQIFSSCEAETLTCRY